tara:strand:+ start:1999 stop:2205 length:207 start_codon:yes stop_codon:yes gene_type:complete
MDARDIQEMILHVTGKQFRLRDILEASGVTGHLLKNGDLFPRESVKTILSRLGMYPGRTWSPYLPIRN